MGVRKNSLEEKFDFHQFKCIIEKERLNFVQFEGTAVNESQRLSTRHKKLFTRTTQPNGRKAWRE